MPLSDLWENLEVDETTSEADWTVTGGPPTGDGDIDWLAFMQDPSLPSLTGQEDLSDSFGGTQTNPWEAGYSGTPAGIGDPTTATGEDIASWIAEMGYTGGTAEQQQAAQDWFVNEFSANYEFSNWSETGYATDVLSSQQSFATLESQMWADYELWEEQNLGTLETTLGELSTGYTTGIEDIEQNRRDQLSDLLTQRRSAETATVASLTDLRRQAGRSGFGARGMGAALTSAQTSLSGYTTSASSVNAMTEQALADIDTQFSSSVESAYTGYTQEQSYEIQQMQSDLELWQAQFEQEMQDIYYDWGTSVQTQLAQDFIDMGEEYFEDTDLWGEDIDFDPFGESWTGSGWCSIPGHVWNPDTGECEGPEDPGTEEEEEECIPENCPTGSSWNQYYCQCMVDPGSGGGGGGGIPGEGQVCPPGQTWVQSQEECVEGGSDTSG